MMPVKKHDFMTIITGLVLAICVKDMKLSLDPDTVCNLAQKNKTETKPNTGDYYSSLLVSMMIKSHCCGSGTDIIRTRSGSGKPKRVADRTFWHEKGKTAWFHNCTQFKAIKFDADCVHNS